MLSNDFTRSFRSIKSLKSFYGREDRADSSSMHSKGGETHADLSINEAPSTVHLPPSIPSLDNLSPKLWNWILSSSFNSKLIESSNPSAQVVVKSYIGQELKPFPPPHLIKQEKIGEGKISGSSTVSSGGKRSSGRYEQVEANL